MRVSFLALVGGPVALRLVTETRVVGLAACLARAREDNVTRMELALGAGALAPPLIVEPFAKGNSRGAFIRRRRARALGRRLG